MIIDAGGVLVVLLVIAVPVAIWIIQRGKRNRTNDLLAQIIARQRELGADPADPLAEISAAKTPADLDAAVRRAQARSEIAALIRRLPPELRDQAGRGA